MQTSFPLPKAEDIFSKLAGIIFVKLDLSDTYTQLVLDEESKKLATLNTGKGTNSGNTFGIWYFGQSSYFLKENGGIVTKRTTSVSLHR